MSTTYAQAQKIMRLVKTPRSYYLASKSGVLLRLSRTLRKPKQKRIFDAWRLDMSHLVGCGRTPKEY